MEIYMQMKDLCPEGNIIDNGWIENLKYDSGKPNFNAILILSEIVYWYRPVEVREEISGKVKGYKKKFKADKLQKNYEELGNRFGISKRQAKDACDFLKAKGIITVEFRTIKTEMGCIPNVMFLEPVFENLKKITGVNRIVDETENDNGGYPTFECNTPSYVQTYHPTQQNVTPPTIERKTNTKITTKTTTEIKSINQAGKKTKSKKTKTDDGLIDKFSEDLNEFYKTAKKEHVLNDDEMTELQKTTAENAKINPISYAESVLNTILERRKFKGSKRQNKNKSNITQMNFEQRKYDDDYYDYEFFENTKRPK